MNRKAKNCDQKIPHSYAADFSANVTAVVAAVAFLFGVVPYIGLNATKELTFPGMNKNDNAFNLAKFLMITLWAFALFNRTMIKTKQETSQFSCLKERKIDCQNLIDPKIF